jgi:hypothetical protein
MQTFGVPWDLSSAGRWMFAASLQVHRAIVAWDTATSEHRVVYAHPGANLYLANFSQDGHWALFDSEEGAGPPRMWAAPFRGLQDVPLTEWVGLGRAIIPAGHQPGDAFTSRKCTTDSSACTPAPWIPRGEGQDRVCVGRAGPPVVAVEMTISRWANYRRACNICATASRRPTLACPIPQM